MATLSCSLILALEQSLSAPIPHHHSPNLSVTVPAENHETRVHHLSDGLDEDVYWHDDEHDANLKK